MSSILTIAEVAALIGDPARANMLFTLKDSGVATAGDLTRAANVAPSTASEHLAKMTEAGLVRVTRDGRKRYYSLTSTRLHDVLDGLSAVGDMTRPDGPPELRGDEAMVHARCCGDHVSGRLGVGLAEKLIDDGHLRHKDGGLILTEKGRDFLTPILPELPQLEEGLRGFATLCHDWHQDSYHLGGALAGGLFEAFRARDWVRRERGAQVVRITPKGRAGFRQVFGLETAVTV